MFNYLRTKKIGIVILDNRIQITYNHHTIEYPFTDHIFWYREVARFEECEKLIKRIFKDYFSFLFRLFGNLEVYVTHHPSSGEIELRALKDIFGTNKCVKKIHLIDFPTAASTRLRLKNENEILIDLDEDCVYVSIFKNGKIIQCKDREVYNDGIERTIFRTVKRLTDNTYQDISIWFIGSNKNIGLIYNPLQKIIKKKVHLIDSSTIILEGIDMIIHCTGNVDTF